MKLTHQNTPLNPNSNTSNGDHQNGESSTMGRIVSEVSENFFQP